MTLAKKCEGIVRSHSFGRKRVVLSSALQFDDFITITETKKHCREVSIPSSEKSALESLPQDVLVSSELDLLIVYMNMKKSFLLIFCFCNLQIRIIFGVDHDDLSRLFHVSKTIREVVSLSSILGNYEF